MGNARHCFEAARYTRARAGVILIAAAGIQNSGDRRSARTAKTAIKRGTFRTLSSTAIGRAAMSASATITFRPASHHRHTSSSAVQATLRASSGMTKVTGPRTGARGGGYQYANGVFGRAEGSYNG